VERLEESTGLLGLVFDPACDSRVVGPVVGQDDAELVLDLAGADAHGECGDRQTSPGGLVEGDGRCRGRGGDCGRRRGGVRGLPPPLDQAGVVVDGLSAASGLPGAAGDRAIGPGEDGGGIEDDLMGEASPSTQTVNPPKPISSPSATEPERTYIHWT
jgi:hypothetical protein